MKRRESKGLVGAPSADLLVCFPSRAHLTLMPKPICSPSRPSEPNKRHNHNHNHHINHHLKKINTTTRFSGNGGGPASPLLWAKTKQMDGSVRGPDISEPTSPKVTCAGQIKVRPRASGACRNWQSVMEEIERIHNRSKIHKKKSNWAEALGFKKDVMNFLTCLRNIRFDFRCFGSFPEPDITSDDDEDDDELDEDDDVFEEAAEGSYDQGNNNSNNNTVFSKWFMVLQDENNNNNNNVINNYKKQSDDDVENDENVPAVPPPNALLLMRCRSAPAKSWLEERENDAKIQEKRETEDEQEKLPVDVDEEENRKKKKKRESLAIVMKYDTDFYNMSCDVVKETWVVGGCKDPFSRSRSWRR